MIVVSTENKGTAVQELRTKAAQEASRNLISKNHHVFSATSSLRLRYSRGGHNNMTE